MSAANRLQHRTNTDNKERENQGMGGGGGLVGLWIREEKGRQEYIDITSETFISFL